MLMQNTQKLFALAGFACAIAAAGSKSEPMTIAVQSGTTTFVATTNVSAISIKGKSTSLDARVTLSKGQDGLQLEQIEARLPVKTLATGMGLRDEHMRRYIFTTADGKIPDVTFQGQNVACSAYNSGHETTCQVTGSLTIRGVARPFTVPLKVRENGSAFKAAGEGTVKLSDYGIAPPTELGVKTNDEVRLRFDFTAQPAAGNTAIARGDL